MFSEGDPFSAARLMEEERGKEVPSKDSIKTNETGAEVEPKIVEINDGGNPEEALVHGENNLEENSSGMAKKIAGVFSFITRRSAEGSKVEGERGIIEKMKEGERKLTERFSGKAENAAEAMALMTELCEK